MRCGPLFVVLAACGRPAMHFDVAVTQNYVEVTGHEAADPSSVSDPLFVHPGACGATSDDSDWCQGACPGEWPAALRLEDGGTTIASGSFAADEAAGGIGSIDTITLTAPVVVLERDDGDIRVPFANVARPVPVFDAVDFANSGVAIVWHTTPPAASTMLWAGGGYGGPFCHVAAGSGTTVLPIDLRGASPQLVGATAYAPPTELAIDQDTIDIWVGASVERRQ